MLVLFGGVPDLVELGCVACCGFAGFPENCAAWGLFWSGFPFNRTRVYIHLYLVSARDENIAETDGTEWCHNFFFTKAETNTETLEQKQKKILSESDMNRIQCIYGIVQILPGTKRTLESCNKSQAF